MAIEVQFIKMTDDDCLLVKDTSTVLKTYTTVQFTDTSSIIDPVLILSEFPEAANYCYIPQFNRYYFIKNITVGPAGKYYVTCHVDVLQSNFVDIMQCSGYVQRGGRSADWEKYLPDNSIPVKTVERVWNESFSSTPFNIVDASAVDANQSQNYLLTVIGGEV